MPDTYTPSPEILDKYAEVLINFALNSGKGVKKGEVVRLVVNESARPLYVALRNRILRSSAHYISSYYPDNIDREYFALADDTELKYFPKNYFRGLTDEIDHSIGIISENNKHELEGIDPRKIMLAQKSRKPLKDWLNIKENAGKFTWTLALYGTPAMAKEANMSLEEYWNQIIKACFLNEQDPISKWKEITKQINGILQKINLLPIEKLHILGKGIDLWITLGKNRKWLGGSGRNIPSFEVFTSPDWRGTNGHIEFNQPLYRYGNLITDIKLDFKDGLVVNSSASNNYAVLKQMLAVENADKIGEFSLTDKRFSRIDRFMAETLFDENISGLFGNTHIALGMAYDDTYTGDLKQLTKSLKADLGFNDSVIHTDIISTTDRTVTAHLPDGFQKIIYQNGQFIL
jgi:aminopeptidase